MAMFEVGELYQAGLKPEDAVMPCESGACGAMPARITNVAGDERRRCLACYERDMQLSNDHWEN